MDNSSDDQERYNADGNTTDPLEGSVELSEQRKTTRRTTGRPKKKELQKASKAVVPGQRGRPKGDAAIIKEYRSRMLASPKSRKVLDAVFAAALDDEHKHQAAAWKLLMDRIVPVSVFEQEIQKNGGKNAITINISGLTDVQVEGQEEAEDAEYTDYEELP